MLKTNNWILGLTGGIGAGKTAVSDYLAQQGIVIVDADVVAREVVEPGSEALDEIKAEFGEQVMQADGSLNRAELRQLIFADENKKQWLNNLLHPRIRESLLSQLQQANSEYVVLSAPLLLKTVSKNIVMPLYLSMCRWLCKYLAPARAMALIKYK